MFLKLVAIVFLNELSAAREKMHDEAEFAADDIIQLPVGRFPDPDCTYNVRFDGPGGKKVDREVSVGEKVFHSWKCSYGDRESNFFCVMVHNCTVSSHQSRSENVEIIDEFGCSLFPTILPHVSYEGDLDAGLHLHAFSLDVDKAAVYFSCNVKMLLKLNGVCRRPTCQPLEKFVPTARFRRAADLFYH